MTQDELRDPANKWITVADVERWMKVASERAQDDYGEAFRFGYGQGIVAVMCAMDDEIKKAS